MWAIPSLGGPFSPAQLLATKPSAFLNPDVPTTPRSTPPSALSISSRKSNPPRTPVCTRTAVVTYLRLASSFKDAEKELRKLYDARSAFVHSGASVTPSQAERLIAYAREILRAMLVLHFKPENRTPGFISQWVKDLDFVATGLKPAEPSMAPFSRGIGIFKS